jgi:nicotinamidase-related amidase
MSGTTLCVIDMQPGFGACYEIVEETIREINLAKRRGDGIVFVELNTQYNKETLPQLKEAAHAGEYDKIAYTHKTVGDGSAVFLQAVEEANWFPHKYKLHPLRRIRVCGVNRHACVENTVLGLLTRAPKESRIEVAYLATAPGNRYWDESHPYITWVKQNRIIIK